ncbi:MAG: hypothetical protein KAT00_00075 [Planctomycetes bacterium]|nr:hypothetical protein [Planctomycetota bacterium]
MRPEIKIEGVEETQKAMAKLAKQFGPAIAEAAFLGAQAIRTTAIQSIQDQSPGEIVIRSRTGGGGEYEHTAAAAGEAPNTDTGDLVNSIQVEVLPTGIFVGTRLAYGGWLELGTKKMKARPWLFPALEANRAEIEKITGEKIENVILRNADI